LAGSVRRLCHYDHWRFSDRFVDWRGDWPLLQNLLCILVEALTGVMHLSSEKTIIETEPDHFLVKLSGAAFFGNYLKL